MKVQIRARVAREPWTTDEITRVREVLPDAVVAINADRSVAATLFEFRQVDGVGSLANSAVEHFKAAVDFKEFDEIEFVDGWSLQPCV